MIYKLILFLFSLYCATGFAAQSYMGPNAKNETCESLMVDREFDRFPIGQNGFVTNRVPLSTDNLINAFSRGYYAIGSDKGDIYWLSPSQRGLLFLDDFNLDLDSSQSAINRRDRQFLRQAFGPDSDYKVTFDLAFGEVIRQCQRMTRFHIDQATGQRVPSSRWIQMSFIEEFSRLHEAGYAHSVEVWYRERLVAGLYGVYIKGVFSGESMFHLTDAEGHSLPESSGAAKLALFKLIERLKKNGHEFIDTQMVLGLVKKWGADHVEREDFLALLKKAQQRNLPY
jgi:leucyl/phenylalanyl-tRNA--protein transferase